MVEIQRLSFTRFYLLRIFVSCASLWALGIDIITCYVGACTKQTCKVFSVWRVHFVLSLLTSQTMQALQAVWYFPRQICHLKTTHTYMNIKSSRWYLIMPLWMYIHWSVLQVYLWVSCGCFCVVISECTHTPGLMVEMITFTTGLVYMSYLFQTNHNMTGTARTYEVREATATWKEREKMWLIVDVFFFYYTFSEKTLLMSFLIIQVFCHVVRDPLLWILNQDFPQPSGSKRVIWQTHGCQFDVRRF